MLNLLAGLFGIAVAVWIFPVNPIMSYVNFVLGFLNIGFAAVSFSNRKSY